MAIKAKCIRNLSTGLGGSARHFRRDVTYTFTEDEWSVINQSRFERLDDAPDDKPKPAARRKADG